ncbi:unnamed protein product [Microthlaspi erraticum]|uniref:Late embryogenesis abundant protein LEA-2 subgroup domain-containing protein n=1 Tax=Microthlaspi erraticum TaxID=1685480 RepID=A0A6D2KW14_9BRAS|nr:unnamed protein product [Microthlaspi erraticum]CAA7061116.1 unnamed protein product [Microthlaspi erraticum]
MATETNSYTYGYPTAPPSSTFSRLREWWSRPILTIKERGQATFKEFVALLSPFVGGLITVIIIYAVSSSIDQAHSHAKFSIQSVAFSPSSATWHVDFLVENPSSRYSIYYDGDTSVRLGQLNVDVFKITRKRSSRDHTAFSLAFDAEGSGNDAASSGQLLHVKLAGKHKRYVDDDRAGHFDITCQNLTRSHENIKNIICHSSFMHSNVFI